MAICEKCKREFEGDSNICPVCQEQSEKLEDRKLSPKRFILIFCDFAIIAICLLVFLIPTFTDDSRNLSGSFDLVTYVENGTLYCKNLDDEKSEAVVLSENTKEDSVACYTTSYSEDGTVVYFPVNVSEDGTNYTLCYYDFKTNGPVTEVAQNVSEYTVTSDASKIFYLSDESLYQHDLTAGTVIAESVLSYENSDDGTKLVYTGTDGKVFLKSGENNATEISKNGTVKEITNNFGIVYLVDESEDLSAFTVKKSDFEGNVTTVSENVHSLVNIYPSGEMYYCEMNDTETDNVSSELYAPAALYYYNGMESQLVSETAENIAFAENTASAVYTEGEKIYHATGVNEKIELGNSDKMYNIKLSNNGTHVYFTSDTEDYTDIYEIRLADGTEPKILAEDAKSDSYVVGTDNRVLYYKENGDAYDLYIAENKVAEAITAADFSSDFASGVIAAKDESTEVYTVSAYINGETSAVAESVSEYTADVENGLSVYYRTADGCFKYNADGTSVLIASGEAEITAY